MIFITAHLFLFQNKSLINKLFEPNFFQIIQEMIKGKYLLEGKEFKKEYQFPEY